MLAIDRAKPVIWPGAFAIQGRGNATLGNGYGRECYLPRFLGRHRDYLNQRILEEIGADGIEWRDFNFSQGAVPPAWPNTELRGIEFLPDSVAKNYGEFSPSRSQN